MSSKFSVPLASRSWADASASSTKERSATSPMVGASLLPITVIVTVCGALVAPSLSVAV